MTEIGDAVGGPALALLAAGDPSALADVMRGWEDAGGLEAAAGDQAGPGGEPRFAVSASASDAVRRALELREQGAKITRDALQGLGYRYSEPSAILPHVTPWGTLGLVNSSTGIAVATDLPVPPDVTAALSGTCGELAHLPAGVREAILRKPPRGPEGWTRIRARVTGQGTRG